MPPHDSSIVEGPSAGRPSPLDRARRKAYWRLIPLVFLCYVIAYIDRSNVAIAKLTMATDLGFDNAVFARAAGIFFLGYFLPEIPGPIIVERWSARKWISRIMITWGIIAALNQVGIALTVTLPVLIAVLGTIAGILVVGVGGGLIKPMQNRWEDYLTRAEREGRNLREQRETGESTPALARAGP